MELAPAGDRQPRAAKGLSSAAMAHGCCRRIRRWFTACRVMPSMAAATPLIAIGTAQCFGEKQLLGLLEVRERIGKGTGGRRRYAGRLCSGRGGPTPQIAFLKLRQCVSPAGGPPHPGPSLQVRVGARKAVGLQQLMQGQGTCGALPNARAAFSTKWATSSGRSSVRSQQRMEVMGAQPIRSLRKVPALTP